VTLFDFDELFVCSYDFQIDMWPNLFKNPSSTAFSSRSFSFHISNKTYFDDFLSILKP
jgi:hypothetical protein